MSSISRRELLSAGVALATTAVAGCAGASSESSSADCESSAVKHGDPDVIQSAMVVPEDDDALLKIYLVGDAPKSVERLRVFDSSGELKHEIPTDDRRSYFQHLGPRPTHGQFRIVSYRNGAETDELVIDFNCWIESDSGWATETTRTKSN
ncbi:hypothetical protein SAMN05421858_2052 [Haladaptatus litoreus]|uniref:Uncharacterized protein n=1 Tax=Haladaptatus litoreus TaxID=553468 RepID=A0A1N6ZJE2_9EURY|nr:hypothetical protein [Haladaptatus litoreus]SIR26841.1 hypothetical protein SAMN05421858_2052 [Haladaptatus litoreus]